MTDREKQIETLQNILIDNGIFNNLICRQDYANPDALINDLCLETAQVIYNNNYRKMDEITLKLDLGDRSAEEIQQIAEKFANEPTMAILAPSNESGIRKQVAKEILNELKFLYKERAREYTNWDGNKVQAVTLDWLNADLDEFAEEHGVEIEK